MSEEKSEEKPADLILKGMCNLDRNEDIEARNNFNQAIAELEAENKKFKEFALKLVEDGEELGDLDYWAEEYLHAYDQLSNIGDIQAENKRLKEENRWIPADEPPDEPPGKIEWDKKVLVLEVESEIPIVMTMAEVFLDEGSEAEYWKPIILPEKEQ